MSNKQWLLAPDVFMPGAAPSPYQKNIYCSSGYTNDPNYVPLSKALLIRGLDLRSENTDLVHIRT